MVHTNPAWTMSPPVTGFGPPKGVRTTTIRPGAREPATPEPGEPPAEGGLAAGYFVQVSSQRTEAEAQSSYAALQAKYVALLGHRTAVIHRADLGDRGTYHRVMIGPFATAAQASDLCDSLKAAGGICILHKVGEEPTLAPTRVR